MDFDYSPEDDAFREEVRTWLLANCPPGLRTFADSTMIEVADEQIEDLKRWQRKMYEGGWVGLAWPEEYGGRGATLMQQAIFNEELAKLRIPGPVSAMGLYLVGPTLMAYGSEEQKKRFLPKILTGEEIWCEGFSEPEAGSDLASLRTRAVEDGDDFVVNGQKVWTTEGHHADWCILLVRTDPNAPKHQGISYLLMDMKTPGVTVRPLPQITGDAEFNEMFLDNVRIPKRNLVGEKNKGWYVAMTTLTVERASLGSATAFRRELNEMLHAAMAHVRHGRPAIQDPLIRQRLAQTLIEVEGFRLLGLRNFSSQLKGKQIGPEGSFGKLYWSEMHQRMTTLAVDIIGPYSLLTARSPHTVKVGAWLYRFLRARGNTIEQGTSEINRNVIAERTLGLPR